MYFCDEFGFFFFVGLNLLKLLVIFMVRIMRISTVYHVYSTRNVFNVKESSSAFLYFIFFSIQPKFVEPIKLTLSDATILMPQIKLCTFNFVEKTHVYKKKF